MVKKYWKSIFWNLFVIIISLIPSKQIPETKIGLIPHFDKVIHFIMYAVLTFFILWENKRAKKESTKTILLIFIMLYGIFLGFFLEILQNSFLIGRNFDIFDVIANTLGVLTIVVFYKMFNH